MVNPLQLFVARPWARHPERTVARRRVGVPTDEPVSEAVFLVLRRMRGPLILLVVILSVSTLGMTLIPGRDEAGHPVRVTPFEAFYFVSYTAMTIGFGEVPNVFTAAQRMWVTGVIYTSVIGWAYAIGALLSLLQSAAFRAALATQQFRRRVRRIGEPFVIVCGYGQAGKSVCRELDAAGRRFVIVDRDGETIELLEADQLVTDPPGLEGDASRPGVLGLAGLGHPRCEGVLALTDDDEANLAVVMTANLLRPDVPVVARSADRLVEEHMHDFAAEAVVNPNDRYGGYLVLALTRPATYQLVTWLLAPTGSPLPERRPDPDGRHWVVCGEGQFADEVAADLSASGFDVRRADPSRGDPDVTGAAGLVCGLESDTANIAMATHARHANEDLFLAVRQSTTRNRALTDALDLDSVFIATDIVAREALARIVTPVFRSFIDAALERDDAWSTELLERLRAVAGDVSPERDLVTVDEHAPALHRWVTERPDTPATIDDILRHPDDRTARVGAVPLLLARDGRIILTPDGRERLRPGDQVLLAGTEVAFDDLAEALYDDATLEVAVTGREVPTTLLGRGLARLGSRSRE